ncbi:hypothetical protein F941_00400 [Acinetobacter bouvetii DSM 14964 = CIP 107468]|uniref:Lipoprotein n=1 Tax=Acinetobacter bouvetii DSM 14964 = CIP 107468 TaxID=1120925 RepID=N9CES4_9GAMM|nr:hypothetical protein [Acinetobacter bouvetii]ENV83991.1 hypothetical protein F941_00400 [Acinetobacter bouvetii DSM 14964 = CIP 107468]BCU65947.1 hypothetical protein ACBO_27380 [Acinetobacter bouvetii]
MNKLLGRFALLGALAAALTACQSIDTAQLNKVKETEGTKSHAQIYCAGTEDCEFERYDQIRILNAENQRLEKSAIKSGILRMRAKSLQDPNALYLSVPAGQHEVVIRFYPISREKAEQLHVIHQFNPSQRYVFKMYRNRSKQRGSLLNVSAPDPLCVDLMQEHKTIRRFCKPYNVLNGLGEFVEKKL